MCLLGSTAVDDGWLDLMLDLARAGSSGLELLDNFQTGVIGDFAEDDVLAVQPGGHDGGDEELRAVARQKENNQHLHVHRDEDCSRIGSSVGHGEDTRLGVGSLEVLVCELLTVDRLSTSALFDYRQHVSCGPSSF